MNTLTSANKIRFLQAKDVKVSEVEFNPDFVVRMIPKLDWEALQKAAENVLFPQLVLRLNIFRL